MIETALLFKAGDRYDGRVLDESARALRARGFLADVRIVYRTYDAASNSVDVEVRVRDAWSLSLNAKLSHSGGKTEWGLGLDDDNFLGRGKEVSVSYKSTIDRDESLLGYRDDNVLNTRDADQRRARQRERRVPPRFARRAAVLLARCALDDGRSVQRPEPSRHDVRPRT